MKSFTDIPAANIIDTNAEAYMMLVPKSGCRKIKRSGRTQRAINIGKERIFLGDHTVMARATANNMKGFTISEGCNCTAPTNIQRVAPLMLGPAKEDARNIIANTYPTGANHQSTALSKRETAYSKPNPITRNMNC